MKRNHGVENLCETYIPYKDKSNIYNELLKLSSKKTKISTTKWVKDVSKHLTKEDDT